MEDMTAVPLKKNDDITLTITGTAHDGSGVGRWEDLVVFVPACAEGDTVKAHVLAVKKNLAYAKLLELVSPSPDRVPAGCPVFARCGGCAFRHIRYEKELAVKHTRVADALRKIGGLSIVPEPIVGCDRPDGYRNKAEYPVAMVEGALVAGFYARNSHRIVANDGCLLQPACFGRALGAFRRWAEQSGVTAYNETDGTGLLRHVYLRLAEATGELMACAVVNGKELPQPGLLVSFLRESCSELKSVVLNTNTARTNAILGSRCRTLWGADKITDILCGLKIELSPLSFYQVNRAQAEKLYALAAERATQGEGRGLLLDLYCGAGTIGLSMADRFERVIGVEIVPAAVKDAEQNARCNGITNATFLCDDAAGAAQRLADEGLRPDVVLLDPPRKGCAPETLRAVDAMSPRRIVYVSCDPATLARDVARLAETGWRCENVTPVDMFPRTAHVETVVLMSRVKD